jgi:hypothetical protein
MKEAFLYYLVVHPETTQTIAGAALSLTSCLGAQNKEEFLKAGLPRINLVEIFVDQGFNAAVAAHL